MVEDDDSIKTAGSNQTTQSAGCHENIGASKDEFVGNVVRTKMFVRRGH